MGFWDIVIEASSIVLPFAGVIVGAWITRSSELERQRKDRIISAYSNFFSVYCETMPNFSNENDDFRRLLSAGEQIKLVCCPEASKSVERILNLIAGIQNGDVGVEIVNLRRIAREEII